MLPFKLVYHPEYDLRLGEHVFPSQKFRLIRDRILQDRVADPADLVVPEPATDEQILLVHDRGWVSRLRECKLSIAERVRLEIPWSEATSQAVWLAAGGTILAAQNALRDRLGFNLTGGFHHAFRGHGEGFCALNDIAIAIRTLQHERGIERAMVVDCDVHHGNGTAAIFAGDPSVFTLSIHQFDNYPSEKPPSSLDIDLPDDVKDEEYLARLQQACEPAMARFRPDLVVYVAGADPYREDQLGGLKLTMDGLKRRDLFVIRTALAQDAAVAVVLAGGYAVKVDDTVSIHVNTVKAAAEALSPA